MSLEADAGIAIMSEAYVKSSKDAVTDQEERHDHYSNITKA